MKVAVTAASGQLGSAAVQMLKGKVGAENIIAIARTPQKAAHLGIEVRAADYDRQADFDSALKGVDAVLVVSSNGPPPARIAQHRNIIEAAKLNGLHKIVYTSIIGEKSDTQFSTVVESNRQTEEDVKASGVPFAIGRNGLYLEPDLDYVDTYVKEGGIRNCGGDGLCGYTCRDELAFAYTELLLGAQHNGRTFNLAGEAMSQTQLAELLSRHFDVSLSYTTVSVEDYLADRVAALGDFMGTIIAGIYHSMSLGHFNPSSDYAQAAGRPHATPDAMVSAFRAERTLKQ